MLPFGASPFTPSPPLFFLANYTYNLQHYSSNCKLSEIIFRYCAFRGPIIRGPLKRGPIIRGPIKRIDLIGPLICNITRLLASCVAVLGTIYNPGNGVECKSAEYRPRFCRKR